MNKRKNFKCQTTNAQKIKIFLVGRENVEKRNKEKAKMCCLLFSGSWAEQRIIYLSISFAFLHTCISYSPAQ